MEAFSLSKCLLLGCKIPSSFKQAGLPPLLPGTYPWSSAPCHMVAMLKWLKLMGQVGFQCELNSPFNALLPSQPNFLRVAPYRAQLSIPFEINYWLRQSIGRSSGPPTRGSLLVATRPADITGKHLLCLSRCAWVV